MVPWSRITIQRSPQPAIFRTAFSSANDRFSLPFDSNSSSSRIGFFSRVHSTKECTRFFVCRSQRQINAERRRSERVPPTLFILICVVLRLSAAEISALTCVDLSAFHFPGFPATSH